jgi:excinuclease ABC subunit C
VPGVYRFLDSAGGVLYIGRATTLRSRVASYWSDLRGRAHLAPMVAQVARVQAVACDSAHEAAWLERNLLTATLPPWNRTVGGQEVPVCIVMDSRPASPRLSVAHLPAPELPAGRGECFGPYLGGRRVRQAVKGLSRCMPLAYTADGLRGADLDIARARRVTQADRPDFVAVISAALRRDPEAVERVRIRLEQLRERAAQALAFELAARITEEIQALEWVTCPQRASSLTREEFTACGCSAGILVSFEVRDGRLSAWTQARCPEADAALRLARTPADWAGFAQRNSELAAALEGA